MNTLLRVLILVILGLLPAACSEDVPRWPAAAWQPVATAVVPSLEPSPTLTLTPTATPQPTATPTMIPTATPTATFTATPRPPTATATAAPTLAPTAMPAGPPPDVGEGERWIEVILSQQTLIAWEGQTEVRRMRVSTGKAQTPTVTGIFRIYGKLLSQTMTGNDYTQPNVPHVMYFFEGYSIHGCYWHSKFGTPVSHGCVNLTLDEAAWLFDWASPHLPEGAREVWSSGANPGTLVVVHG